VDSGQEAGEVEGKGKKKRKKGKNQTILGEVKESRRRGE